MRDALGGVINIQFILVFIVLVSGYLAFSVNYTKAFRAKNKIIDVYESYEGNLKNPGAQEKINSYLKQIGYKPASSYVTAANANCGSNCDCSSGLYCIENISVEGQSELGKNYAEVTTFISIDFPIINQILPHIEFFKVKGSTKTVYTNKTSMNSGRNPNTYQPSISITEKYSAGGGGISSSLGQLRDSFLEAIGR